MKLYGLGAWIIHDLFWISLLQGFRACCNRKMFQTAPLVAVKLSFCCLRDALWNGAQRDATRQLNLSYVCCVSLCVTGDVFRRPTWVNPPPGPLTSVISRVRVTMECDGGALSQGPTPLKTEKNKSGMCMPSSADPGQTIKSWKHLVHLLLC